MRTDADVAGSGGLPGVVGAAAPSAETKTLRCACEASAAAREVSAVASVRACAVVRARRAAWHPSHGGVAQRVACGAACGVAVWRVPSRRRGGR